MDLSLPSYRTASEFHLRWINLPDLSDNFTSLYPLLCQKQGKPPPVHQSSQLSRCGI